MSLSASNPSIVIGGKGKKKKKASKLKALSPKKYLKKL